MCPFLSSVIDFCIVTKTCSAMEVVEFLNTLYTVMDKRMDDHDVYKVETISDSYLVVSGVPKVNGDKYESGSLLICPLMNVWLI